MHLNNHYNINLKEYARKLRTETDSQAEKFLWKSVLSRKKTGERFLRQRPIYNYIVDFFAPEIGLIVEIDGNSHWSKENYDTHRQEQLERLGYVFLRLREGDVIQDIELAKQQIDYAIFCLKGKR